MTGYRAPIADMQFVLRHIAQLDELAGYERFAHVDPDETEALLDEAGRFFGEVVAPLNPVGDTEGLVVDGDSITTPTGFVSAYQQYVDAGWGGVPFEPDYGGGGFPWAIALALQEMLTSASMAFSLCPLLTQGAVDLLTAHGSEEQKEIYLAKMISGEWTGTMNLTEPQAGSDVGALTARALRQDDGSYRITGTKIFITYGEHDMADNIVHLVLARTPDSPPGTKGISLFLVPKFLPDADGHPGERNDLKVVSTEHKIGIHASPTCVMSFGDGGGATGFIVGEEGTGMRGMFTMMNNARLSVGLQGLALAERAYQQAVEYARDRRQGRAIQSEAPPGESSAIVDHADVRRMLMTMRSQIEAMRCVMYANAAAIDQAHFHPDPDGRARGDALAALLTPVSKGWGTDLGVELTSLAIQVHGGMGYVEETGVAQHWRDSRIAPIYEGTNGIQAMDLVFRKLPMAGGDVVKQFAAEMAATAERLADRDDLADIGTALGAAVDAFVDASTWLGTQLAGAPNEAAAGAAPYLRLTGVVMGAYYLARSAEAAADRLAGGDGDAEFLTDKVATARFYAGQILPQAHGLVAPVTGGSDGLYAIATDRL